MKIIKHSKIYGMSYERNKAIKKIEGLSEPLEEHLIKCIVYEDSTGDLHHWIYDEISEYFNIVNAMYLKPGNKKLKPHQYDSLLLGCFGDSRNDVRPALEVFRTKNDRTEKYPIFKVDNEMIDRLYDVVCSIRTKIIPILSTKNDMDRDDFYNILDKLIGSTQ